jgi:hypothetical protein
MSSGTIVGGPPGSVCFDGANTWGAQVDGCADNRAGLKPVDPNPPYYGGGSRNDNHINPYYGPNFGGPGVFTLEYQLDAPMGTLLTENSDRFFALAFFASTPRGQDPSDVTPGGFSLDTIGQGSDRKGDRNPLNTLPNVIPWQQIPGFKPNPGGSCNTAAGSCTAGKVGHACTTDANCTSQASASATLSDTANPLSNRNVTLVWDPVRLIDDGSVRPSPDTTLGGATGVGVRDQPGALVRYQVQVAPLLDAAGNCGAYTDVANGATTNNTITLQASTGVIPPDSCLRLKTNFGRTPSASPQTQANATLGVLGDLGYEVFSSALLVGGQVITNDNAILRVATKNKNAVTFRFDTTSELNVTGFEILGKDQKGTLSVLGRKSCTECTTGRGASYELLVPAGNLKGAKTGVIRTLPGGALSNEVPIQ